MCSVIVESGRKYAERNPSVPLMYAYYDTEYLGKYIKLVEMLYLC